MKRLLFAVVALLFAACTTDVTEDVAVEAPETLTVSFEEDTRIQLMNGKTVWNEGDLVSVFYKSDANDCYKFTGITGERTSELLRVSKGEKSRSGDHIITVYPYNEDYIVSLSAGTIEAHLPAEQTYVNESFGIGSSPMVSMSEYKQVVLKNVCGWLKVQFTGDGEVVDKITLRGNSSEQVAGDIMIVAEDASTILASAGMDIDDTEVGGTLVDEQSILTEVSLICPDGVTLSSEPTSFYIALPPQTFSKGLTVTLYSDKSGAMKQTTDKSITISRNIVQPLASVEANLQPNKIYYTSTDSKIVTPYRTTAFGGANIVSNTYENGQGVIIFDAPVTEIGSYAFEFCRSLTSVTIPDSVTTLGDNPFYGCSKLTEFNGKFASADKRYLIVDGVLNSFAIGCGLTEYAIPNSVTEIGSNAFRNCSSLTSVTIPNSVTEIGDDAFTNCSRLTSVTIPDSVTKIGSYAFEFCSSLTSVTIPDSVTEIGKYAFKYCSSLTSVTIPDSVTTLGGNPFRSCSKLTEFNGKFASADKRCLIVDGYLNSFAPAGLTEYTIPDSVTVIGNWAFEDCSSLTSVTIPDSVTKIGSYAFQYCSSLKSVYCNAAYPPTLVSSAFGYSALENIYVYAESVDTYKAKWSDYADKIVSNNKSNSDSITFTYTSTDGKAINESNLNLVVKSNSYTNGVGTLVVYGTAIPDKAFYQCTTLKTITTPNSVSSIGDYAFYKCSSLTSVTIPNSVTEIGFSAFSGCSSLTSVTIPDSVTKIEGNAFRDCSSLKDVYYTGDISAWCKISFESYDANPLGYGAKLYIDNKKVTEVTIPSDVAEIKDYAFYKCSSLASVTIPDSVTKIGSSAFYKCSSLASVTIPDSVTKIGSSAFSNCTSLASISISDSVTTIGGSAFYNCSSLTNVTIPDSVTKIGSSAFSNCTSLASISISDSVTTIGGYAFYNCSSLKSVYLASTTPPTLGAKAFQYNENGEYKNLDCTIYVPSVALDKYKNAEYWSDYAADIEEYEFTE